MDTIAVVDFGGQYAHLIATRVRRMGVYSEIVPDSTPLEDFKKYKGIILSGGPQSVYADDSPKCDERIFDLGIPILGICYGMQFIAHTLGGKVEPCKGSREYGIAFMETVTDSPLFAHLDDERQQVWMSHGDSVTAIPDSFDVIGKTDDCPFAAVADESRHIYGMQFHVEVTHTTHGDAMLENFVCDIVGAKKEWELGENYLNEKIQEIKDRVGDKKVFLLVSGGVDSTVAFAMIAKAVGNDRVTGLFVDTGLMRKNEGKEVADSLKALGVDLQVYEGADDYFAALADKYEPEDKRKIIGDLFLKIKDKVSEDLGLNDHDWLLGQGTIYPDTIESGGTKNADKIKTHHNRVDKIEQLIAEGKVIEPLVDLYKDEVRKTGELLGIAHDMVWRHPFPGPGLGVRCLCLQETFPLDCSDNIESEIAENDIVASAHVLPIKSVGVQGDARSYKHPIALRFNELPATEDAWTEIGTLSSKITNGYGDINRAIMLLTEAGDITAHPHSYITPERISLLQEADHIVTEVIKDHGLYGDIWQFPVVLVPVQVGDTSGEMVILRPVNSTEAMTASFSHLPKDVLEELITKLTAIEGVSAVAYDITNKPPGTIEWE